MMQTLILLNSKVHSKNVLYPKNVPYTIMCKTATGKCKYSRANMMSELKTHRQRNDDLTMTRQKGALTVNWKHWFG